jgi:hypothetical protein
MQTAATITPSLAEGDGAHSWRVFQHGAAHSRAFSSGVSDVFPDVSEFNSVTALEIVAE